MKYTRLGNSGLIVSRIAFGTMTLGDGQNAALARIDATEADRLVGQALDVGVNLFDTANIYNAGESERLLGKALGTRRDEVVVATKVGMRVGQRLDEVGLSTRHIHRSLDDSLARLGMDHVDVLFCHRPDPLTPLEETLAALDRVVQAGKVRYLGFSNWPAWLAAKAVTLQKQNGLAPFVTGQMYYSLVGRDLEHEYVPFALDAGIGTMVWSPLNGGFLSGKYTREDPTGGGGRLTSFGLIPFDREKGYDIVDRMRGIASSHGTSVAAVAIAWLAQRPTVSTVIAGFGNERQLQQNLEAADLELTPEDMMALDEASAVTPPYPQVFLRIFERDPALKAVRPGTA